MSDPAAVPLTHPEVPAAAAMLARAFADDPFQEWLLPDASRRARDATRFFAWDARKAIRKGWALTTPDLGAAALWLAPGRWRDSWRDVAAVIAPSLLAFRMRTPHVISCLQAVEEAHPREPHWYLAVLGSDPSARGTGAAKALVRRVLDRCDAEGTLAYLESSKEANIGYYERFGFRVTGEIRRSDMAPLWSMQREPEAG